LLVVDKIKDQTKKSTS